MDAAAELGRNLVSKYQIQPEYGDEQADAGRDGGTRLARPNSQARTGTGEYYFPCSADHEQDWQPYPVDPYSAICDDHTYIHTYIPFILDDRFVDVPAGVTQDFFWPSKCVSSPLLIVGNLKMRRDTPSPGSDHSHSN